MKFSQQTKFSVNEHEMSVQVIAKKNISGVKHKINLHTTPKMTQFLNTKNEEEEEAI